jgi:hypothetical protein
MMLEDNLDFNNEIVPVYVPLIDELAKLLGCGAERLPDRLNHPLYAQKVENFLRWKRIRTTYTGKDGGNHQDVSFHMLSTQSAHNLHAYEGYLQITVRQHYYCLHKIKLIYPFMKCLTEIGRNGHCKFYPLELLEVKLQSPSIEQPSLATPTPVKRTTILQHAKGKEKEAEEEEDGSKRATTISKNWNDSDDSSEDDEEVEDDDDEQLATPPSNDGDDPAIVMQKKPDADYDDYDSILAAFKNLN